MLRSHLEKKRELGHRSLALEEYVPIRVDCPLQQEQFSYAAASLKAGEDRLVGTIEIIDVPTERVGLVAACVGPLVTGSLPVEWLKYHGELGVDHFFTLCPQEKSIRTGSTTLREIFPTASWNISTGLASSGHRQLT